MRELDSLAPSDFSENCPVLVAPDFSFIRSFTRADKKSLQIGCSAMEKGIKLTDAERVCFKESVAIRQKQSDKWTRITLCGTNCAGNKVFCSI